MTELDAYISELDDRPSWTLEEHSVDEPTKVLYRRQGGSSGQLGGGSFGAVHPEVLASDCEAAPVLRAVKIINKRDAEASKIHWQQEVENLIVLSQYPKLFVNIHSWWEDKQSIYLPMEFFQASDLSRNQDRIRNEDDIKTIARQIALGLHQMHRLGIIHRDIKPHNISVARYRPEWQVKIGDFGFSKRISDSVSSPFSTRGTIQYMAPEYRDLLNNSESSDFTTAVDMWSFGYLVYELFTKKCPFDEGDALLNYLRDGTFPARPLYECGISSDSIQLIVKLLDRDTYQRCDPQDVLQL
ncbi:MAG: hypothetical protein Q9182_005756 [Xanthomendoza sp. 2 TL-2023]